MKEKSIQKTAGQWLLCFLPVLLFMGAKALPEYCVDTYATYPNVMGNAQGMLYRNGRPVIALVYWIWARLGIPGPVMYRVFFWCAIFFFSSAIFLMQDFLLHHFLDGQADTVKGYALSLLTAFLLLFNPLVIEYFTFVESGCFGLAAFLSVCAFRSLQRYFEAGQKKDIGLALLFLLLSYVTYQALAGMFVVLNLPFILKYSHDKKTFLVNNALVAGLYGAPGLLMMLVMKYLWGSTRLTAQAGMMERLRDLFYALRVFKVFPFYSYFVLLPALIVVVCIRAAVSGPARVKNFLRLVYLGAGTFFTGLFPSLIYMGYACRINYPMGAAAGILLMEYLTLNAQDAADHPRLKKSLFALLTIYLAVQYLAFQQIIVTRYQDNAVDEMVAKAVTQRVEAYEAENGIEVTKISFYYDSHPSIDVFAASTAWGRYYDSDPSIPVYAYSTTWSRRNFFIVYTGRKWEEIEHDPAHDAYFHSHDWTAYSDDQLIFDGDTLNLCIW